MSIPARSRCRTPDIIQLIGHPLKLAERGPTKTRVFDKIVDFVTTFIYGIAA